MPVRRVAIVKRGTVTLEPFEEPYAKNAALKKLSGLGGGSTVTLIESDARVLVDTGFDFEHNLSDDNLKRNERALVCSLRSFGLRPEDIDMVFITHWHRDHYGNLGLFAESEVVTSKPAVEKYGLDFTGVKDGKRVAEGVMAILTPGHTSDHASLILETERLRYSERSGHGGQIVGIGEVKIAVAGDAIVSESYYATGNLWKYNQDFHSEDDAVRSIGRIESLAEYIIAGHGGLFRKLPSGFAKATDDEKSKGR